MTISDGPAGHTGVENAPPGFVGRTAETGQFEAAIERSGSHLFIVWGAAGLGKSALLGEFRRLASLRGFHVASLDLSAILVAEADSTSAPERLSTALVSALAVVAPADRRTKRMTDRFRSEVAAAADRLISSGENVHIHQTADRSSQIRDVHIDIHESRIRAAAAIRRFHFELREALERWLTGVDLSRTLLTLDTAEILELIEPSTDDPEHAAGGVGRWFYSSLIPTLAEATNGPTLAIAGREKPPLAEPSTTTYLRLEEWREPESQQYLGRHRIEGELADQIYTICRGVPLWTALVAEMCVQQRSTSGSLDADWLRTIARQRPASEWVPQVLLARMPPADRAVLSAATLLRTVTYEGVEAILRGDESIESPLWWQRLLQRSFIQVLQDGQIRIHELVRVALLTNLRQQRPRWTADGHRAAVQYFTATNNMAEVYYHAFAVGDTSGGDQWQEDIDSGIDEYAMTTVYTYLDAVLNPDYVDEITERSPVLRGWAELLSAEIDIRTDDFDSAITRAERALRLFASAGDHDPQVRAHRDLAFLAERNGDFDLAARHRRDGVNLARIAKNSVAEGAMLRDLAEHEPQRDARLRLLESARAAFEVAGNAHALADILRTIGDAADSPDEQLAQYRKAADIFEPDGCACGRAEALEAFAHLDLHAGEIESGIARTEAAGALYREMGLPGNEAKTRWITAEFNLMRNQFDIAKGMLLEAIGLYRVAKDPSGEARVMLRLAEATAQWEGHTAAFVFIGEALERYSTIHDGEGAAAVMETLGDFSAQRRDWPAQQRPYEIAVDGYRRSRAAHAEIRVLMKLADGALAGSGLNKEGRATDPDPVAAYHYRLRAYELSALRNLKATSWLARAVGDALVAAGRMDEAEEWIDRGIEGLDEVDGHTLERLAQIKLAVGDPPQALAYFERAFSAFRRSKNRASAAYVAQEIGDLQGAAGQQSQARESYALARLLFDETASRWEL